jgi:hypothetical protein
MRFRIYAGTESFFLASVKVYLSVPLKSLTKGTLVIIPSGLRTSLLETRLKFKLHYLIPSSKQERATFTSVSYELFLYDVTKPFVLKSGRLVKGRTWYVLN